MKSLNLTFSATLLTLLALGSVIKSEIDINPSNYEDFVVFHNKDEYTKLEDYEKQQEATTSFIQKSVDQPQNAKEKSGFEELPLERVNMFFEFFKKVNTSNFYFTVCK